MLKQIFTTEELEEMEKCRTRICLQLLMAAAVIHNLPEILDKKMPTSA